MKDHLVVKAIGQKEDIEQLFSILERYYGLFATSPLMPNDQTNTKFHRFVNLVSIPETLAENKNARRNKVNE